MAAFHRADLERVHVFPVDGQYLFKHYFEGGEVFDQLRPYYNNQQYRFEVPPSDFEALRGILDTHGYALVVVDAVPEFVVAVRQYTTHPENIFKDSVAHRSADGFNCFLMTDQPAVERAVAEGATRITDTDVESPF